MNDNSNNSEKLDLDETSLGKTILLILILVVAFILVFFKFKKAQKDLGDHLKSKKDALAEILNNIEKAKKDKEKLLFYKNAAKFVLRLILVSALAYINLKYVQHYFTGKENIPAILGAIVDINALLLLITSSIIFLWYGSFLELKNMFDAVQNIVLQKFFGKKEELIDAILRSNLENKDSIKREIEETEAAIKANEELFAFMKTEIELN